MKKMQPNIQEEIRKMTKIQLKDSDLIRKGSFEVYRYKIGDTQLDVKCFTKEQNTKEENAILQKISSLVPSCPGIIQYYGMKKLNIQLNFYFMVLKFVRIVGRFSEEYEGYAMFFQACLIDLTGMLKRVKKLQFQEIFNLLSQMSQSLLCLHQNQCFHGDIKPDNILVDQDSKNQNIYYLTDFTGGEIVEELKLLGTPFYFAPELMNHYNKQEYDRCKYNPKAADVYALGIVILELLIEQKMLQNLNITRLDASKYAKELEKIKEFLQQLPEFKNNTGLLEIIINMVNYDAEKRPKAIEICQQFNNK